MKTTCKWTQTSWSSVLRRSMQISGMSNLWHLWLYFSSGCSLRHTHFQSNLNFVCLTHYKSSLDKFHTVQLFHTNFLKPKLTRHWMWACASEYPSWVRQKPCCAGKVQASGVPSLRPEPASHACNFVWFQDHLTRTHDSSLRHKATRTDLLLLGTPFLNSQWQIFDFGCEYPSPAVGWHSKQRLQLGFRFLFLTFAPKTKNNGTNAQQTWSSCFNCKWLWWLYAEQEVLILVGFCSVNSCKFSRPKQSHFFICPYFPKFSKKVHFARIELPNFRSYPCLQHTSPIPGFDCPAPKCMSVFAGRHTSYTCGWRLLGMWSWFEN